MGGGQKLPKLNTKHHKYMNKVNEHIQGLNRPMKHKQTEAHTTVDRQSQERQKDTLI